LVIRREVAGVAPGEGFEAEVEDAVEFVERDAHVEAGFGGGEAIAAGLLHDGESVEIEPADGGGIDGADSLLFFGFEPGAKWGDAIFDKIETGALHDVIFVVVGGGDDFFGDTEGGADFGARELAVFEELEIGGGKPGNNDFVGAPKEERAVGETGATAAVAERGADLLLLFLGELLVGANDEAGIGVVIHQAVHEGGGGEIGFGGEGGDAERGEAAPEIVGVRESIEPDFFGEEDLGFEGRVVWGGVAPTEELVVFDDGFEVGGVQKQDAFDLRFEI